MKLAVATLLLVLGTSPQVDVKGRWEGTISAQSPEGTTNEDSALLLLEQKDKTITGTIGGSDTDQHPITTGTIEGNKVVITAKHTQNGREYRVELTVDGDTMKGTVFAGDRQGQVVVKKRKE